MVWVELGVAGRRSNGTDLVRIHLGRLVNEGRVGGGILRRELSNGFIISSSVTQACKGMLQQARSKRHRERGREAQRERERERER